MDALVGPVAPAWRLGDTLAGLRYCSAGVPKMFRWRRPAEPVTFCFHSTCEGGAGFFNQRSTGPLPARTFLAWTAPRRRDPGETLEGLWCRPEVDRVTLCGFGTCLAVLAFVGLTFTFACMASFRTQYCCPVSGPD